MEATAVEDIVIVGAGIAGLATALGLHRLGIRSLVLETSDSLRAAGYALTTWNNAWKALDALGVADSLRRHHDRLAGNVTFSAVSGLPTSNLRFTACGEQEARTVMRKSLLEALAMDLPKGTIRYSSKLVSIEESAGFLKLLHLADGTLLKTKVLIGCDGVKSVVAKWLGFKKPSLSGRNATRGITTYENGHGFENNFMWFFSKGLRFGVMPCNANTVYWFSTWHSSKQGKEIEENPVRLKQHILSKLGKVPDRVRAVVEDTKVDSFVSLPLRCRQPWELVWNDFFRGNVCIAGDALHSMTPDLGQGGCSALEDGVVLARCLAEAMLRSPIGGGEEEYKRIEKGLEKYAKERRWRCIKLIATSYVVGSIQESEGKLMNYLRDNILADFLVGLLMKFSAFDCGTLTC
ncbi:monooxygenase 2-like isoform X2 [Cucurbita moschata]|uniref:Monooxygenase 2-like isoform X1 n=1 Tax=Cucurbita moschata TaxID=3662 RepID=A0A6J1GMD2_CUCMO|nr:monooxygenase 2-like isoform X1 [Cucurbita moschata]XP_022953132.1 monooxygenase 2-like isoform X2 [Cucurbita moschata]